ncbi:hypothetical protein FHX42_001550 [Saccharopolyspora lacisalsi]|uniref:Uncharacterized protein n=1 Tax=Halosaccharopolyspora lacisalsi TaxID=1000566 RepID=A0A839DYB8_9PSEU|nr:hypothetical protein [Halosaccharopolyspora lacisalsi]MBA8824221.1 hypothetical protein [Halosaccharopolyspora lacisalsi]
MSRWVRVLPSLVGRAARMVWAATKSASLTSAGVSARTLTYRFAGNGGFGPVPPHQ